MTARSARSDPQASKTTCSDRPPIKSIVSIANTYKGVWGDEKAASED
ncbi:MAG: hypothetical protein RIB54_15270 [Fulvivirga sp.]